MNAGQPSNNQFQPTHAAGFARFSHFDFNLLQQGLNNGHFVHEMRCTPYLSVPVSSTAINAF